MPEITLQVGMRVAATQAEGPGWRYALWLQGCPLRCPGCCNPEYLSVEGGSALTITQLLKEILATQQERLGSEAPLEGVTFLGGEPFAQAGAAAFLAERVREHGLSVLVFTGFELEELQQRHDPATDAFLRQIDVLIDGPYRRDEPETIRRWIGSSNQRMHLLTDRYSADDPRWTQPNTLEIRLTADALEINGFPLAAAKSLWAPRAMYPVGIHSTSSFLPPDTGSLPDV